MATTAEHNGEETVAPTIKNIGLGGDIYLIFGPEGCKIRVKASKALLSFASSYFRAIFAATFKEGGELDVLKHPKDKAHVCATIAVWRCTNFD